MATDFLTVLYILLLGHALADFALQSDSMGRGKNRNRQIENLPPGQTPTVVWPYWLSAHAGVHAAAVGIVTHSVELSMIEFVAHWLIDFNKCENRLTVHEDQALHVACKIVYAMIFIGAGKTL